MAIGKINPLNWERIGNGATVVNQEPWGGGGGAVDLLLNRLVSTSFKIHSKVMKVCLAHPPPNDFMYLTQFYLCLHARCSTCVSCYKCRLVQQIPAK